MAFLAARPTNTTSPICTRMLLSSPPCDPGQRGQHAHRHDHHHGQRQGQGLIQGGQHQEDEDDGQPKMHRRGIALGGGLFLQGDFGPFDSCSQAAAPWPAAFHRGDGLAGRDARGAAALHFGAAGNRL
jgi:hypothetical protein